MNKSAKTIIYYEIVLFCPSLCQGDFGLFKPKFISRDLMAVNVIAVLPAILLGKYLQSKLCS